MAALRNRDGAGLIEFALVTPVLLIFIIGIMEISMVMLVDVLLEGSVRDASRFGITGRTIGGQTREEYIASLVNERLHGLATVTSDDIEVKVYESFASIAEAEELTDLNDNGVWDEGEAFVDSNGNGTWDADPGVDGAGGPDDIVVYRVSAQWQVITPLIGHLMKGGGLFNLRASVAVRNEPFTGG